MNSNNRYYPKGHSVLSKYWKDYKKSLPTVLPDHLFHICIGLVLGDATLYKTKKEGIKFKIEQGYKHKDYVEELLHLFKDWTFYQEPYAYIAKKGPRMGMVKSYSFRTFAHPAFDILMELFISSGKKVYKPGVITEHLSPLGLCYWIADDGSLHARSNELILHTQGFSIEENKTMCLELNNKFGLHATVKPHKEKYVVIYIPASDASTLIQLLEKMPSSMLHKRPRIKSTKAKNL